MSENDVWKKQVSAKLLGRKQIVKGLDPYVVERKARALVAHWRKINLNLNESQREHSRLMLNYLNDDDIPNHLVDEVLKRETYELKNILNHTLDVDDSVSISALYNNDFFNQPEPELEPTDICATNQHKVLHDEWSKKKDWYYHKQNEYNRHIRILESNYQAGKPDAIIEYCDMVLTNSCYPTYMQASWTLAYNHRKRSLSIHHELPHDSVFMFLSRVVKSNFDQFYLNVIKQCTIRSIHEILEADKLEHIKTISYKGFFSLGKLSKTAALRIEKADFVKQKLSSEETENISKSIGLRILSTPDAKEQTEKDHHKLKQLDGFVNTLAEEANPNRIENKVKFEDLPTLVFFDVKYSGGKNSIVINKNHPIYESLSNTVNRDEVIKLLLQSWVEMESQASNNRREQLSVARQIWGEKLGDLLRG